MWQLREQSHVRLSVHKFSVTVLVPSDAFKIDVEIQMGAEMSDWGAYCAGSA